MKAAGAIVCALMVCALLGSTAQAEVGRRDGPVSPSCARLSAGGNTCPGVRPGGVHWTPLGQCTFNFAFKGSNGDRYIGSAGHCFLEEPGEFVGTGQEGPDVLDSDHNNIGDLAYAVLGNHPQDVDFALVRIKPGVTARAAMCFFGGPTGLNDDITTDPVVLKWFGNGGYIGWEPSTNTNTLPSRWAVATEGLPDPNFVEATGAAFFGDSGSAVISDDGRAVGVAVTLQPNIRLMGITRLGPQVERAEEMLGETLKLRTAKVFP
jgi:hypothetical protein